jgi:hypothetical protein
MSKRGDFSAEVDAVSATVERDVGAFMKLVREDRSETPAPPVADAKPEAEHDEAKPIVEMESAPTSPTKSTVRSRSRTQPKTAHDEPLVLVNVTTRLTRETNELLTDAALRQRLEKKTPATRQDIVEAALQDWFRRHGYGRRDDSPA